MRGTRHPTNRVRVRCRHLPRRDVAGTAISVAPERMQCLVGKEQRRWFPHSSSEAVALLSQRRRSALQSASASLLPLGALAAAVIAIRRQLRQRVVRRQRQQGQPKRVPLSEGVGMGLRHDFTPLETPQAAAASNGEAGATPPLDGLHRRARLASLVHAELGAPDGGSMSAALLPADMSHQLGTRFSRGARGSALNTSAGQGWLPEMEAHSSKPRGDSAVTASLASRSWGLDSHSLQVLPGKLEVMLGFLFAGRFMVACQC